MKLFKRIVLYKHRILRYDQTDIHHVVIKLAISVDFVLFDFLMQNPTKAESQS